MGRGGKPRAWGASTAQDRGSQPLSLGLSHQGQGGTHHFRPTQYFASLVLTDSVGRFGSLLPRSLFFLAATHVHHLPPVYSELLWKWLLLSIVTNVSALGAMLKIRDATATRVAYDSRSRLMLTGTKVSTCFLLWKTMPVDPQYQLYSFFLVREFQLLSRHSAIQWKRLYLPTSCGCRELWK